MIRFMHLPLRMDPEPGNGIDDINKLQKYANQSVYYRLVRGTRYVVCC